jgi:glyoxylase-like metal-dependent hydrolase (beta-lactamase superfamily II)
MPDDRPSITSMLLAPDIWRITTPLPFRPRSVHAYLLRDAAGGWALVDGGIDTPEAWAALDAGVRAAAGGWAAIGTLVVTHMHMDHIGLASRAKEASGARLLMGALDAERAAHAAAHPEEEASYRARLLEQAGAPTELRLRLSASRGAPPGSSVAAEVWLAGSGGELPGVAGWRWVWTPGHTAGHIALLREADGVLIAGDAVLPRVTPTIGVNRQREDPVGDYLDALARLQTLAIQRVFPGHGEPIERPAERIAELREATRAETAAVAALLEPAPRTAWEVVERRYPGRELPDSAWMQALRETLAHLQHLARSGVAVAMRLAAR